MTASPAAVAAAQEKLGCEPDDYPGLSPDYCEARGHEMPWTDRGCPVAVAVADAVAAIAAREALKEAADKLDLPGSDASGYYASEAWGGYAEAERDAEAWLRARAEAIGGDQ